MRDLRKPGQIGKSLLRGGLESGNDERVGWGRVSWG